MGPRSKGKGHGTAKYEDPGRMIVIDGPNVSASAGVDHYAMEGLVKCVEYYQSRGYPVLCVIPNRFLLRDQLEGKKKREDFTYRITARDKLFELKDQRVLVITPAGTYDDTFAIQTVIRTDGCIVSNDIFRDGTKHAPQKWLDARRISFTFLPITMDFIPNADFIFPPRGIPPHIGPAKRTEKREQLPSPSLESWEESSEDNTERRRRAPRTKSRPQSGVMKMSNKGSKGQDPDKEKHRQRVKAIAERYARKKQEQCHGAEAEPRKGEASKKGAKRSRKRSSVPSPLPTATLVPLPTQRTEEKTDMDMDIEDDLGSTPRTDGLTGEERATSQENDSIIYFTSSGLKIERPKRKPQAKETPPAKGQPKSHRANNRDQTEKSQPSYNTPPAERASDVATITEGLKKESLNFTAGAEPFVPLSKRTLQPPPSTSTERELPREPAGAIGAKILHRQKESLSLMAHKDTKTSRPLAALKKLVASHKDTELYQTVHQMVQAQQTRQPPLQHHHAMQTPGTPSPAHGTPSLPPPFPTQPFPPQPLQGAGAQQGASCGAQLERNAWQAFAQATQGAPQPFCTQPTGFTGSSPSSFYPQQNACPMSFAPAGLTGGSSIAPGVAVQNGFPAPGGQFRFM